MRKLFVFAFTLLFFFYLCACSDTSNTTRNTPTSQPLQNESLPPLSDGGNDNFIAGDEKKEVSTGVIIDYNLNLIMNIYEVLCCRGGLKTTLLKQHGSRPSVAILARLLAA